MTVVQLCGEGVLLDDRLCTQYKSVLPCSRFGGFHETEYSVPAWNDRIGVVAVKTTVLDVRTERAALTPTASSSAR